MTNNFNEQTSLKAWNTTHSVVAVTILISVVSVFSEWNYIESHVIKNTAWKTWVLNVFIICDLNSYLQQI